MVTGESAVADLQSKTSRPIVRYVIVGYLIGSFLWRVLTPAHEYPGRFSTYLEMALDALVIAGLTGAVFPSHVRGHYIDSTTASTSPVRS